ncbi:MMPL family transporter [Streptomyces sp. NPDC017202]|uniref:MMPL family transporter n=1 Tax=Streptomyces sp. NPDC017202 TaxID=3364981 RepID=UPI00378CC023
MRHGVQPRTLLLERACQAFVLLHDHRRPLRSRSMCDPRLSHLGAAGLHSVDERDHPRVTGCGRRPRRILHGLTVTGGVITSAGVVLAATFCVLAATPTAASLQQGLPIAIGILLDTSGCAACCPRPLPRHRSAHLAPGPPRGRGAAAKRASLTDRPRRRRRLADAPDGEKTGRRKRGAVPNPPRRGALPPTARHGRHTPPACPVTLTRPRSSWK